MRKWKSCAAVFAAAVLAVSAAGCGGGEDFDAKGYVQAVLDAKYQRDYAAYAEMLDISEDEAKEDLETQFNDSLESEMASAGLTATDEQIAQYQQMEADLRAKVTYEVQDAVKDEDDNFTVDVVITPLDSYDRLAEGIQAEFQDAVNNGATQDDLTQVFLDFERECIDNGQPKDPVTVTLNVTYEEDGNQRIYSIPDDDYMTLEMAVTGQQ